MNHTHSRNLFRLFSWLFLLPIVSSVYGQGAGDTTRQRIHYRYSSITLVTGTGVQLFNHCDGLLQVSFPYSVTDASGVSTNHTFSGQKNRIYLGQNWSVFPVLFEIGGLHHFVDFGFCFRIQGNLTNGSNLAAGYGFIWYADTRRTREPEDKRMAIKVSLNLNYSADAAGSGDALLGSIDNANKTIYLLGHEADPTFTTGGGRSPTVTNNAKTLNVSYSQRELSLLPRVSIANNPYRSGGRWELLFGYNFPLTDRGGIYLKQEADQGHKGVSPAVNINNPAISASYNGRPVHRAPYRFGGVYAGVLFGFGRHREPS